MNANFKRILSAVLAVLTIGSAMIMAGCSDSSDSGNTETTTAADAGETTAAESTEPSRENTPDNLPELNFEGKTLNFFYRNTGNYTKDVVGEAGGDIVADAMYNRNLSVEERLNIKFNLIPGDANATTYCNQLKTAVLAGDDAYDLVSAYQAHSIPLILEGCMMNLYNAPYLDFDQPWWNIEYMEEILIGDDKLYFMIGDIALFMFKSMSAMFFNKNIYEDNIEDPAKLYETVEAGEWVFDDFAKMTTEIYKDANGNGTSDRGDLFGFTGHTSKTTEHFMYDAGIRASERDSDGIPKIVLNNEKTIRYFEKFYSLYFENKGAFIVSGGNDIGDIQEPMFTGNEVLFLPGWIYMAENFRDMEADYGIIPYPKYDENQDEYLSLVHDGTTIYCIPATCTKLDMTAAAAEALAAEAYRTVTPAFYEVALKNKYSRDDASSRIIDIIYNAATTDFLYANNYSMNNTRIGLFSRAMVSAKSKDFASEYAKIETAAQAALDALVKLYTK